VKKPIPNPFVELLGPEAFTPSFGFGERLEAPPPTVQHVVSPSSSDGQLRLRPARDEIGLPQSKRAHRRRTGDYVVWTSGPPNSPCRRSARCSGLSVTEGSLANKELEPADRWADERVAVAKLDNPAGRLHTLLSEFKTRAEDGTPILTQWADVLGTESPRETLVALAEVAGLIPDIERELWVAGDADQIESFKQFSGIWVNWVTFSRLDGHARSTAARSQLVNDGALAALGSISSFLSLASSEGEIPSTEAVDSLREQAKTLLESVVQDGSLPPEVRRILMDYIHRLLWALDNLRIGGPEAVGAAADRLFGHLREAPETTQKTAWDRIGALVCTAWTYFKMGPQVAAALDGWQAAAQDVMQALPPGQGS
jgi:hypothetical protein